MAEKQTDNLSVMATKAGIIFIAVVGVLMTIYTTGSGAWTTLGEWYTAFGVTVFAVGFLVVISFVFIGTVSVRRPFYSLAVLAFYAAAVFACWIFSFTHYYDRFNSNTGADFATAEKDLSLLRAELKPLQDALQGRVDEQAKALRAAINGENGFAAQMSGLADELVKPEIKDRIQEILGRKAAEARDKQRADRDKALAEKGTAKDRLDAAKQAVSINSDKLETASNEVAALEGRIAKLKEAITEEGGAEPGAPTVSKKLPADSKASGLVKAAACKKEREVGKGGPGTCYDALNRALAADEAAYRASMDAKMAAERAAESLAAAAADASDDYESAGRQAETDAPKADAAAEPKPEETKLPLLVKAFQDEPSGQAFAAVAVECLAGVDALKTLSAKDWNEAMCRPAAVDAMLVDLDKSRASLQAYVAACTGDEQSTRIVKALDKKLQGTEGPARSAAIGEAFAEAKANMTNPCIQIANSAGIETTSVASSIDNFLDNKNPSLNSIGKGMGKIAELATGDASYRDYWPAIIALIQELSLLVAKSAWTRLGRRESEDHSDLDIVPSDSDPVQVAAAKNLLRMGVHDHGGMGLPIDMAEFGYSADMRGQMGQIIGRLLRNDKARKKQRSYFIYGEGIDEIAAIVRKHQTMQAALAESREKAQASEPVPGLTIVQVHPNNPRLAREGARAASGQRQTGLHTIEHENGMRPSSATEPIRLVRPSVVRRPLGDD